MLGLIDGRTIAGMSPVRRTAGLITFRLARGGGGSTTRAAPDDDQSSGDLRRAGLPAGAGPEGEPGGLRDLTVMRAIAASWVTDVPRASLTDRTNFARCSRRPAHHHRRGSDKTHAGAARVAALLGIPDPNGDGDGVLLCRRRRSWPDHRLGLTWSGIGLSAWRSRRSCPGCGGCGPQGPAAKLDGRRRSVRRRRSRIGP